MLMKINKKFRYQLKNELILIYYRWFLLVVEKKSFRRMRFWLVGRCVSGLGGVSVEHEIDFDGKADTFKRCSNLSSLRKDKLRLSSLSLSKMDGNLIEIFFKNSFKNERILIVEQFCSESNCIKCQKLSQLQRQNKTKFSSSLQDSTLEKYY